MADPSKKLDVTGSDLATATADNVAVNRIIGGAGNDTLDGGGGNDIISGSGVCNDLHGGAGLGTCHAMSLQL